MPFTSLSAVKHRIRVGMPLPFNVRNADHTLLLARGQQVDSQDQLDSLFERGALVDLIELQTSTEAIRHAAKDQLPRLWGQCMDRVGQALQHAPHHGFQGALDDATVPVVALIERDPDLAIFQILRQGAGAQVEYGARRSVNCGITAFLVAQRLGWDAPALEKVFKVALTANLSMLELQGQLSRQTTEPTQAQRDLLQHHPTMSRELLAQSGITDEDWLQAVAKHHEMEDGSGYPTGCTDVGDLASLVRRADVYTSKLASRNHRDALAADQAGRQMFMEDPGHPMTAALVKEFGIYPPGCCVRLASGETGIVVQRGASVTSPIVACLTNARGAPLGEPMRVDTGNKANRVEAIVGERTINARITAEKLMSLTLR